MTATLPRTRIRVTRGDDWAGLIARWLDADREPVAIDSARMQIRRTPATDVVLGISDGDGLDLSTPGEVAISFTAEQTQALAGGYCWDLEATAASGLVRTIAGGALTVDRDITRD